jgi:hypothetical protein
MPKAFPKGPIPPQPEMEDEPPMDWPRDEFGMLLKPWPPGPDEKLPWKPEKPK